MLGELLTQAQCSKESCFELFWTNCISFKVINIKLLFTPATDVTFVFAEFVLECFVEALGLYAFRALSIAVSNW